MLKRITGLALGALSMLALSDVASAQDDFYNGERLTYIITTDPGGGYDTYGRLVAKYLEKHLPGSQVVVQNVPGAGHIVGTNTLSAAEPRSEERRVGKECRTRWTRRRQD